MLLAVLVLSVFIFRLWLAFQTPSFSYDAYFHLRQIESISETGKPLFNDPLSYQGRTYVFAPLFYYVLAFFSKLISTEMVAKIIPNLFFSISILLVYLIVLRRAKKEWAALLAAFFTALIPQSYAYLINVSPVSLAIPLGLFMIYCLMDLDNKKNVYYAILCAVFLTLTHALIFLFVFGFILYFCLLALLKHPRSSKEVEFTLFLFFLAAWFNFILYKKAFLAQGLFFLWQNVPAPLRAEIFGEATFLTALYAINFIPFLFGIYTVYHTLVVRETTQYFLFVGLVLGVCTLLLFSWIQINTGLLFLGYFVVILSSRTFLLFVRYIKKTKFPRLAYSSLVALFILFILTTFLPMFLTASHHLKDTPQPDQVAAFQWIRNHALLEATVLAAVKEGQALSYYTHRKNIIDTNLFLAHDIHQRYSDLTKIYTSRFQSTALQKINQYHINYIYFSNESVHTYGVQQLYFTDNPCFRLLYEKGVQIYGVICA